MMPARATILIGLLLAPCLLPAQSLEIVSTSDAVGESDSGADSIFVEQARPASVSDDGSVVFVSLNVFDAINDDNDLFDVYRRSLDTTDVVSAYHDLFNPSITEGHAEIARFDNSQDTGIILRQSTVDAGYFFTTLRKVYLIDGNANEISLAPPALNVNLPVMSADGNALAFTADGDAVDDGGTGNGVFAAVRDTGWELVRISALTGGDAAISDTMTLYDESAFLDQPTDRYGTPAISNSESHGLQVVFTSNATNLPDASFGNTYIYLRQHGATSSTVRISNRHVAGQSNDPGPCHSPAISDDGNYVAFVTTDPFIAIDLQGDTASHVYLLTREGMLIDNDAPETSIVDVNDAGEPANADSVDPRLSETGRFIVFRSKASNLDDSVETQGNWQIYLRDRIAGTTECISHTTGTGADADCFAPGISPSGRYITFISAAANLGNDNGAFQVYRFDRGVNFTNIVPVALDSVVNSDLGAEKIIVLQASDDDNDPLNFYITDIGGVGDGELYDGSVANNLPITAATDETPYLLQSNIVTYLPNDGTAHQLTFSFKAREQDTGFTEFSNTATVSVNVLDISQGVISILSDRYTGSGYESEEDLQSPFNSGRRVELSRDGHRIVFDTEARLEPNDNEIYRDVYFFDRSTTGQQTFLAIPDEYLNTFNADHPALSPDGNYLVFETNDSLDNLDVNGISDIYLTELGTGNFTPVSLDSDGMPRGNSAGSAGFSIADNADRVVFTAPDPTSGKDQIYLWERQTGSVRLLSTDLTSLPAVDDCSQPMISGSGNAVVFLSKAQLTAVPTGGQKMAYVHVIATGETIAASAGTEATAPDGDAIDASVSWYGSLVAFGNLNAVFIYNLADDTLTKVIEPPSGDLTKVIELPSGDYALYPRISMDGRLLYFASYAKRNGNAWDENPHSILQAYLLDRNNGDIRLVSNIDGEPGDNHSYKGAAAIGASGDLGVAFASQANNLAGNDIDDKLDVFFCELLADANQPPTSTTATAVTLDEDAFDTINFAGADENMNEVGFFITALPANGQLFDGDGDGIEITAIALPWQVGPHNPRVTFVPALNYNNSVADRDQFSFRYEDLFDSSPSVAVTLAVDNVNDDPAFDPIEDQSADEGATFSLPILVSDPDTANSANPDVLTLALMTGPGEIVDEQWVYTPGHEIATRGNLVISENICISVNDGNGATDQVDFSVTINDVNVAPTAADLSLTPATPLTTDVLVPAYTFSDFDGDIEGDSELSWFVRQSAAAEFTTYSGPFTGDGDSVPTSATSFEQDWQFTITPIDDRPDATPGTTQTSTIVTIANSAPVGTALNVTVAEDDSAVIDLQGTDADAHPLTFSFTPPQHGVVTQEAPDVATVVYTPATDYFGDDDFSYTVNDGFTDSETATVTVTVTPTDDAPTLTITNRLVLEAGTVIGYITTAMVVVDDADAPSGIDPPPLLTVHLDADPFHGTFRDGNEVVVSAAAPVSYEDFPLTYTANDANAFQTESVGLTAHDATLSSSTKIFQIISGAHLQTISVERGWNFIAFAADPVDGPTELFVIDGVQRHRGKLWYLNNGNYVSAAASLSGGVGYWAWFSDAATFVDVPGAPKSNTLDIPAGWQGIGITGSATPAALPTSGITGTVWGWDVGRQRYINAVEFEHGKGYVVMSQGTTVTFEQP